MKNKISFIKLINSYKLSLLIFTILGFLIGYFICYGIINPYFCTYDLEMKTSLNPNELFTLDYFEDYYLEFNETNSKIEASNEEIINNNNLEFSFDYTNYNSSVGAYNKLIEENIGNNPNLKKLTKKKTIADIDYKNLVNNISIEEKENDTYIIHIKQRFFKNSYSTTNQNVLYGKDRIITYLNKVFVKDLEYISFNENVIDNSLNYYLFGGITSIVLFLAHIIVLFIYSLKNKEKEIVNIYNNETIFKTPFHKKYWIHSKAFLKNFKSLVTIAILFALMMTFKLFRLPSGFGDLGIGLTYLVFAVISMLYGPIAGLLIGFLSDNIGFFINGGGIYFPGYTLDAMAAGLIYALFFYKTKITFSKCLYSRIIINLFVNVIFGSLWYCCVFLNGFTFETYTTYLFMVSLPKNIFYLLPQSIVLFCVLKALAKPLERIGLMEEEISNNISLF